MKKTLPFLLTAASAIATQSNTCPPEPPAPCFQSNCDCQYCLGPAQPIANAPALPHTCNGDIALTVAGFYWASHEDGLEYAIDTQVRIADPDVLTDVQNINRLIDAQYKSPSFKWDFGFKVGLAYHSPCDGWDIGVLWTWYRGRASSHDEAEPDDNHTLVTLWSEFTGVRVGVPNFANDIETDWHTKINLIDIPLGRTFWVSKYLTIRPHIGLRIASLDQKYHIDYKGGIWNAFQTVQPGLNDEVDLNNDFFGVGVLSGLNTNWHFSCGFSLYGHFAASIIYGRFHIDHDEMIREAQDPFTKTKILETEDNFHCSRAIFDLDLGVQWSALFCDCKYGFTAQFGWEQHLFFHQNQMWRVGRMANPNASVTFPDNDGENLFYQRRGSLSTEGWTLTLKFEF